MNIIEHVMDGLHGKPILTDNDQDSANAIGGAFPISHHSRIFVNFFFCFEVRNGLHSQYGSMPNNENSEIIRLRKLIHLSKR